jgi:Lecithin retinol acyltransferase
MGAVRFRTNFFFDAPLAGRGDNGDARISNCKGPSCEGRHRAERPLVAEQELPLGSHLVTPRRAYLHHGIYVGDGKVVHYAGLAHGLGRGPVEEVSLARFTNGHPVRVRSDAPLEFDRGEVIRRARSRVGEDHYRLLTNNCEHFCEWCLRGEHRSYQVEEWLTRPVRALHAAIRFIAHLLCPPGGFAPRAARPDSTSAC